MSNLKSIMQIVDPAEVIKLSQNLVQLESPPGKEKEISEYIINYMESKGLHPTINRVSSYRYNIIARLKGQGIFFPILFSGYMDVAPLTPYEQNKWKYNPYGGIVMNGELIGRGAVYSKGSLGSALSALAALSSNNIKPPGDIIFAVTVDKTDSMLGVKELINSSLISDAAKVVLCAPTNMEIHAACKGRMWIEIKVFGDEQHASIHNKGLNAIHRTIKLISLMEKYDFPDINHAYLGQPFWQTTVFQGGTRPNTVPDSCTVILNVRMVPGQTPEDICEQIKLILEKIRKTIPDFTAEIREIDCREPWEISENDIIVRMLARSCDILKIPVKYSGFHRTTEGSIYKKVGITPVIFGPGRIIDNACEEKVAIDELVKAAQVYSVMMLGADFLAKNVSANYSSGNSQRNKESLNSDQPTQINELINDINKHNKSGFEQSESIKILKLKKLIQEKYMERITLKSLSEMVYLSPSYLSSLFKKCTGLSLVEYLTEVRLNEAKVLLVNTDRTVDDIAHAVGLGSNSYMTELFKKEEGITPSEYRKMFFRN